MGLSNDEQMYVGHKADSRLYMKREVTESDWQYPASVLINPAASPQVTARSVSLFSPTDKN